MSVDKMEALRWIEQKYDERYERMSLFERSQSYIGHTMRGDHLTWVWICVIRQISSPVGNNTTIVKQIRYDKGRAR